MRTTNLFVVFVLLALTVYAQETSSDLGPLVTDRPDATESASVVPKGFLQVETGAFYTTFDSNGIKTDDFVLNTTLVRIGLLHNLELRLGWDLLEQSIESPGNSKSTSTGLVPLLLGTKISIAEEKNGWPELAFIGHVRLPFVASDDFRPETTGVDFRFSVAHTLNERSSLSYNIGAFWFGDNPEAAYLYTLAYGYSITEKIGAYVELYGDFPENSKANHLWDAGFTYLVSDNVQLDATVGSGITDGQDLLLSGGVSFRIPIKKQQ